MMRRRSALAIAVRKPTKEIILYRETLRPAADRLPLLKLPVLRGVVSFIEMLVVGTRALMYSANCALEEEEEELSPLQLALMVFFSLVVGIAVFMLLPTVIMHFIQGYLPQKTFLLSLGEGVFRLLILFSYIISIARMPDVRRVFQYHGAEHKSVHCYEAGKDLTVNNARGYSTLHPRCGTAFLLVVVFVSILLFSLFSWRSLFQRLALRLLLLPLVAGLAYEIIRLAGKRSQNPVFRMLLAPGLLMQKLTTAEPDDEQLEVALKALRAVLGFDTDNTEFNSGRNDSHAG
ncbi:MAG TPA: DUF1385 domain-containing protein [Firmicutes bacterium]|nr:DUF1385 domain-containing protein [Bacillota bacterium]